MPGFIPAIGFVGTSIAAAAANVGNRVDAVVDDDDDDDNDLWLLPPDKEIVR